MLLESDSESDPSLDSNSDDSSGDDVQQPGTPSIVDTVSLRRTRSGSPHDHDSSDNSIEGNGQFSHSGSYMSDAAARVKRLQESLQASYVEGDYDGREELLDIEFPADFIRRFALSPEDIRYNTIPAWLWEKRGNMVDWEARHDPKFLIFAMKHAQQSELCFSLANELRLASSRHLYTTILPAVEPIVVARDYVDARSLLDHIHHAHVGNMFNEADEDFAQDLIEQLARVAYPVLHGVPATIDNIREVLNSVGIDTQNLKLKREFLTAYSSYCQKYNLQDETQ